MTLSMCDLCSNPYPYMCSECCDLGPLADANDRYIMDQAQSVVALTKKIWIGSGEDGHMAHDHHVN